MPQRCIEHNELASAQPFCVVEKDGLRINLFENKALAKEHNPGFRLVTNDFNGVYKKVSSTHPQLLHPNLKEVTLRPWVQNNFAVMDKQLGIINQQWPGTEAM